jgi:hypothetical protein
MEKIPTAEEFFKIKKCRVFSNGEIKDISIDDINEYTKLHVEAALYVASERADLSDNGRFPYVDKESILNAYSLENIK